MQQSIPPETYDRDYFLSETCEGYDEFRANRGVSFNKAKQVRLLGPGPDLKVLDAGCGRGEVLLACAQAGAEVAGIDYSEAAVGLTKETLEAYPDADIRRGDITGLPWPDATFDRIQHSDTIEHLDPPQTVPALREFHRVLRPGGYLVAHTAPNRLFKERGWPVARPVLKALGHDDTIHGLEAFFELNKLHHPNEQSLHSLRRALKEAGFVNPHVWVDPDVVRSGNYRFTNALDGPVERLAVRIAAWRPIRLFYGNDLLAVARKS